MHTPHTHIYEGRERKRERVRERKNRMIMFCNTWAVPKTYTQRRKKRTVISMNMTTHMGFYI